MQESCIKCGIPGGIKFSTQVGKVGSHHLIKDCQDPAYIPPDILPGSEKNQVHTGDLTHCKQTLQLNKFYLIKSMKSNRRNWLAQFKFPFLSILWSFLLPKGNVYSFPHFIVFCSSVCFPCDLNYWKISIKGSLIDAVPNSPSKYNNNSLADSEENYPWDLES